MVNKLKAECCLKTSGEDKTDRMNEWVVHSLLNLGCKLGMQTLMQILMKFDDLFLLNTTTLMAFPDLFDLRLDFLGKM